MQRAYSIACERHPDRNEDAFIALDNGALGVFDGLGGHPGSERASALAAEYVAESLGAQVDLDVPALGARDLFTEILWNANQLISREQRLGHYGIATTAIITQVFHDPTSHNQYAQFAHSGDSRAYLYRHGRFVYTTLDHATSTQHLPFDEQWRIQRHLAQVTRRDQVDPYDWPHISMRNGISSCLDGSVDIEISTYATTVERGDLILLTSDGVHDNLTTREIRQLIGQYGIDTPHHLVNAARYRSRESRHGTITLSGEEFDVDYIRPKPDDMTAVVRIVE